MQVSREEAGWSGPIARSAELGRAIARSTERSPRIVRPAASVPIVALVSSIVLMPSHAVAQEASAPGMDVERRQICERRGIERVVELRETPGSGLPCEVVYLKPDEDGSESVLWMARNDRAFCTARFDAFLVKLESKLDWSCERADGTVAAVSSGQGASSGGDRAVGAGGDDDALPSVVSIAAAASEAVAVSVPAAADAPEPALAGAVSGLSGMSPPVDAVDRADGGAPTRLGRLLAFAPPGAYAAVPMPSNERAGDVRVSPLCPTGGLFSWKAGGDPEQPVFSMGGEIELTVRLPESALGAAPVLGIVSSVGQGATRELQTLSPASSGSGRAIDLRVAPRGPGSGALSPEVCRYALGG